MIRISALAAASIAMLGLGHTAPADIPAQPLLLAEADGHAGHGHGHAGAANLGDIAISDAAARASIGAAPNSAVYMTIATSGAPDRLIAGATPAARFVELHETRMQDGAMVMMPVEGIPVAAGAPAELKPAGLHIMLIGLTAPAGGRRGDPAHPDLREGGHSHVDGPGPQDQGRP